MMVDTGAAVTIVTTAWAEAHGLKVKEGHNFAVRSASGEGMKIQGTTSFTVQITPMLELDLANITVQEGSFYQGLLGMDVLAGKAGVMGPAILKMSGPGTWGEI